MTYEQAKERFENFGNFCDDYNEACDSDCGMCSDMEDRILEALEKQIPKKVIPFEDNPYLDATPVITKCGLKDTQYHAE